MAPVPYFRQWLGNNVKWLFVLVGLMGLAESGLSCFHWYIMNQLRPADRDALHAYVTKPFTIPQELRHPAPWSAQFKQARENVVLHTPQGYYPGASTLHDDPNAFLADLETTGPVSAPYQAAIEAYLQAESPILKATSECMESPEFSYDALVAPPPSNVCVPYFYSCHAGLVLPAYLHASRGDWEGATSTALHLLNQAVTIRDRSLRQDYFPDMLARPAQALAWIATQCPDTSLSRAVLRELDSVRLDPTTITKAFKNSSLYLGYVAGLRGMELQGFSVDFSFSETHAGFDLDDHLQETVRAYSAKAIASLPPNAPPGVIRDLQQFAHGPSQPALRRMVKTHTRLQELVYEEELGWVIGHFGISLDEPDRWRIYLDLARLRAASALFEREHRRSPSSSTELVPDYLKTEPIDPTTSRPYTWDPSKKLFHSGPAGRYGELYTRFSPRIGFL